MATLRIFSDLHLGHPASTIDRVGMLRPLFDGIDGIWFNGDTVETCSGLLATESLAALGELTRTLESLGIRWETLPGNHDPDRGGPALRELENGEVVVTHGDMCFRYGSPWSPWVPKIMHKLVEAEQELGGYEQADDLADRARLAQAYAYAFQPRPRKFTGALGKLETIKHAAWPPTTPLAILNVWINGPEMVAKWMEQFTPAAKVLVMGHTHRPGLWFRRVMAGAVLASAHGHAFVRAFTHNRASISSRSSSGTIWGAKRPVTLPSRSTRNLVKFHLMALPRMPPCRSLR